MITLCCQTPAWGTIGIAEWQTPTPGGNMIGNNDNLPSNTGTAMCSNAAFINKQVSDSGSIINGITTDVIIATIALAVVDVPL